MKVLISLFLMFGSIFGASNDSTITGATAFKLYLRNYSYANMVTDLPILSFGLATDLNRLLYKNSNGTLYKMMVDASGSSNTAQNRIFYANSTGQATNNSGFTFDGSIFSAPGGIFSDSLKSSTLNTGNGNNELYAMNQNVRSTDSINAVVFNSTRVRADSATIPILTGNVGISASSLQNWSSDYRSLQVGANAIVVSPLSPSSSGETYFGCNTYITPGHWKAINAGRGTLYSMNNGIHAIGASDSVAAGADQTYTTRLLLDSVGTLKLNPDIIVGIASPTPNYLQLGNTFSDDSVKTKCKLYFYNNGGSQFGLGIGSNSDIQYHSDGRHDFYINNALKARINTDGITADSLGLTKGISCTQINTGIGNTEVHLMNQNVRSTDSINAVVFNSTRVRADSATIPILTGNVGVSSGTVKPWHTDHRALQVGNSGAIMSSLGSANNTQYCNNTYYSDNWRAINTGKSTILSMNADGSFGFYSSDSVAAGAVQTTTTRMALDTSGNVKLNPDATPAPSSTPNYLQLGNTFSDDSVKTKCKLYLHSSGGAYFGLGIGANSDIQHHSEGRHDFYINNAPRLSISDTGVGIGTKVEKSKLHVHNAGNVETQIQVTNGLTGNSSNTSGISLGVDGGNGNAFLRYNGYGNFSILTNPWVGSGERNIFYADNWNRETYLGYDSLGKVYLRGTTYGTFNGNLTGNVTGNASTSTSLSGGSVSATTGAFSGVVGVDSLNVTNGINCNDGLTCYNATIGSGYKLQIAAQTNKWDNAMLYMPSMYASGGSSYFGMENPHLFYSTNNSQNQYGKAGLRMASDTLGSNWWEAGVSSAVGTPFADYYHISRFMGGTNTDLFTVDSVGNCQATSFRGALYGNATTVTNGVYKDSSYSNPSWITGINANKITATNTSYSCTLFVNDTLATYTDAGRYCRTGNIVTVYIPAISFWVNTSDWLRISLPHIPNLFGGNYPAILKNDSEDAQGLIRLASNGRALIQLAAPPYAGGNCGITETVITMLVDYPY